MDKISTFLDGSIKKQTESLKELLGLRPEQSFQDLEVDEDDD